MDGSHDLCNTCRAVNIAEYFSHNDPVTTSMGHFQDILKNENCTLCKLIVKALSVHAKSYWQPGKYPIETCYLGRFSGNSTPGRVEVWFHATSKTLPDGIWGHSTVLGRIKCLDSLEPPLLERLNYSLIRSWMDDCATRHGQKCNPPGSDDSLPLLLLDVKRMRLFKSDRYCRYLALSYVWGKAKQFRTVKSNFQQLQQDGAFLRVRDQLPQLINDAITFVADLGETYLWVDALCIVQDDPEAKELYVPQMDRIYGQALLTVVAVAGSDANCALPGVVAGSRVMSQSPVQLGSLMLFAEPRNLATTVESSTWRSRAWTFQEGILARKRLYFSDSQVYWQCSESHHSEDGGEETGAGEPSSWSMNVLERQVSNDPRLRFNVYESLVKQYSRRALTYPSDSLNAFVGILSAIRESFGWQFASALPESLFDFALLWSPMWSSQLRPRESLGSACKSPTWCWTAWEDDIYWDPWRLDSYVGKRVTLKAEVRDFMITDKVGVRKIIQDDPNLRETRTNCSPALSEALELVGLNERSANYALVFEALSLGVEMYTISSPRPELSRTLSRPFSDSFTNSLRGQLWIYDAAGHHCGTLRGFNSWKPGPDAIYEFVLLSRSDQDKVIQADVDGYRDHLPLEYPSADEYYEEVFDASIYQHKRWWALNILLVERKGDLSQRLAVGQLHADAWHGCSLKMKTFVLV